MPQKAKCIVYSATRFQTYYLRLLAPQSKLVSAAAPYIVPLVYSAAHNIVSFPILRLVALT